MKYEFRVGDYVETKTGTIGYVSDAVDAENKCLRWMPTKLSSVDICDNLYILNKSYCINEINVERRFNRIGQYDFTKKDEGKIEKIDIEKTCSMVFMGREKMIIDVISNKINKLVEAVNELRDKND